MLRHCVVFRWSQRPTEEELVGIRLALDSLPSTIPAIHAYHHGPDAGLVDGNWDYAVVGDFADGEAYASYAEHPAHVALIRDLLRPRIAERVAVQFEW